MMSPMNWKLLSGTLHQYPYNILMVEIKAQYLEQRKSFDPKVCLFQPFRNDNAPLDAGEPPNIGFFNKI
jgi:hypothetical protein